jgi:hypothetical protein
MFGAGKVIIVVYYGEVANIREGAGKDDFYRTVSSGLPRHDVVVQRIIEFSVPSVKVAGQSGGGVEADRDFIGGRKALYEVRKEVPARTARTGYCARRRGAGSSRRRQEVEDDPNSANHHECPRDLRPVTFDGTGGIEMDTVRHGTKNTPTSYLCKR